MDCLHWRPEGQCVKHLLWITTDMWLVVHKRNTLLHSLVLSFSNLNVLLSAVIKSLNTFVLLLYTIGTHSQIVKIWIGQFTYRPNLRYCDSTFTRII